MLEVHQLAMTAWPWLGITSPNIPASEASFQVYMAGAEIPPGPLLWGLYLYIL